MAGRSWRFFAANADAGGRRANGHLPFLITLGAALLVYGGTLAPDLTWANWGQDGGELLAAAVTLGAPHPPGYPAYTLLGKLFSLLPLGTLPGRFNLFSAVCAGLAAAVTAVTAQKRYAINNETAVIAGLTLALSPLVWGQAIITEVYALNLLAVALVVWSLADDRPAWQTGLLLGLSLTTHLTSFLLLPLVLWHTPWRKWGELGAGTAVGLTPFLLLPLLAGPQKPIVWGDPQTISGWWRLVSGQIYRPNLMGLPLAEFPDHLRQWGILLLDQFTPVGWMALLWGIKDIRFLTSHHAEILDSEKSDVSCSQLLTVFLYFIYAFSYRTNDAVVNFLPGLLLLTLLMVPGLRRMGRLAWVLPMALLLLNLPTMDLRDDWRLRQQTEALLAETPPRAILLTPGDATITAVWALHFGEGQRPDLIPVDANLFAFAWYRRRLGRIYPDLAGLERDDLSFFEQMNGERRPFCRAAITLERYQLNCNETP